MSFDRRTDEALLLARSPQDAGSTFEAFYLRHQPGGFQTLALCEGVGDRAWKPFWLGGDGLPPKPHLNTWQGGTIAAGIQIPERLDGSPASGSAADGARRR